MRFYQRAMLFYFIFGNHEKCNKIYLPTLAKFLSQIVLAVSQIMWAKGVHEIFALEIPLRIDTGLISYLKKCVVDLNDLAALTRQDLSPLFRRVLCALITVDVHARDTVEHMVEKHVQKS